MMDLETFLRNRAAQVFTEPRYRPVCWSCRRAASICFCAETKPFASKPRFVILIHPLEARRSVATGRLAHRCLVNSQLIEGVDFTHCPRVNALLNDPQLYPMILYPGRGAVDLSILRPIERPRLFPEDKEPVLFVIDGTWRTARKTMHVSENLRRLPAVCFTPSRNSRFRVRKQPNQRFFSTIEAIHETLELFGPPQDRRHDNLLEVFDAFVGRQLEWVAKSTGGRHRKKRRPPVIEPSIQI